MDRITHPFERWPARGRRRALVVVAVAALAMQVLLTVLDAPLRESPEGGTVALELAGSPDRAAEIVDGWRADDVLADGAFITGLDYLFAPLYGAALAGAGVAVAAGWRRRARDGLASLGLLAAWAALAAAAFDWIENLGLAVTLLDEPASPWPQVSLVAAVLKFAGIAAAVLYLLGGFGLRLGGAPGRA